MKTGQYNSDLKNTKKTTQEEDNKTAQKKLQAFYQAWSKKTTSKDRLLELLKYISKTDNSMITKVKKDKSHKESKNFELSINLSNSKNIILSGKAGLTANNKPMLMLFYENRTDDPLKIVPKNKANPLSDSYTIAIFNTEDEQTVYKDFLAELDKKL
ncbi:MAG: hypothetical protein HRT47_08560 [Candidatus Caenarcaniphilales bacterium]|nr:hypothetical protein [Candidatus Caenarcaniphilales bacterium]